MKNTHLFKRLRDKKGLAMESAVLFLVITFAFCSIIMTLALLGRSQSKIQQIYLETDLERNQIAEDIMAYIGQINFTVKEVTPDGGGEPVPTVKYGQTTPASFWDFIKDSGNERQIKYYIGDENAVMGTPEADPKFGWDPEAIKPTFEIGDPIDVQDVGKVYPAKATYVFTVVRHNTDIPVLYMEVTKTSDGVTTIVCCLKEDPSGSGEQDGEGEENDGTEQNGGTEQNNGNS